MAGRATKLHRPPGLITSTIQARVNAQDIRRRHPGRPDKWLRLRKSSAAMALDSSEDLQTTMGEDIAQMIRAAALRDSKTAIEQRKATFPEEAKKRLRRMSSHDIKNRSGEIVVTVTTVVTTTWNEWQWHHPSPGGTEPGGCPRRASSTPRPHGLCAI